MKLFDSILLAADFSGNSREAFRVACLLSAEGSTRIRVIHVEEPLYVAEEPIYHSQPSIPFTTVERDPAELRALDDRLREFYAPTRPIHMGYTTREGSPADEILRAAEDFDAGLIVVGTHGRKGLSRLLAGSVAEEVLRKAKCPVMALRSPAEGGLAPTEFRCIVAPVDLSESSRHSARVARLLARRLGARLVLLQVVPSDTFVGSEVLIPVDLDEYRKRLVAYRDELDGPDLKSPVEAILRQGQADDEILETAKAVSADLIVMGTHGRTGLARLLMGSVAEGVLRGASCPVLTVKPAAIDLEEEVVGRERRPSSDTTEQAPSAIQHEVSTTSVRVSAEQLREAEASRQAHLSGPSIRDRMVTIGRGNQQAGRQGS